MYITLINREATEASAESICYVLSYASRGCYLNIINLDGTLCDGNNRVVCICTVESFLYFCEL